MKGPIMIKLLPIVLLLGACATPPTIQWVKVVSVREASEYCSFLGKRPMNVRGCMYRAADGRCVVVAPDGETVEALGILGHEIKHCFDGSFHKKGETK